MNLLPHFNIPVGGNQSLISNYKADDLLGRRFLFTMSVFWRVKQKAKDEDIKGSCDSIYEMLYMVRIWLLFI